MRGHAHRHPGMLLSPVELPHCQEVTPGQDVRIDDEERPPELVAHERKRSHGAEWLGLERVVDAYAELAAVAQALLDHFRLVVHGDGDLGYPRPSQPLDHK